MLPWYRRRLTVTLEKGDALFVKGLAQDLTGKWSKAYHTSTLPIDSRILMVIGRSNGIMLGSPVEPISKLVLQYGWQLFWLSIISPLVLSATCDAFALIHVNLQECME